MVKISDERVEPLVEGCWKNKAIWLATEQMKQSDWLVDWWGHLIGQFFLESYLKQLPTFWWLGFLCAPAWPEASRCSWPSKTWPAWEAWPRQRGRAAASGPGCEPVSSRATARRAWPSCRASRSWRSHWRCRRLSTRWRSWRGAGCSDSTRSCWSFPELEAVTG